MKKDAGYIILFVILGVVVAWFFSSPLRREAAARSSPAAVLDGKAPLQK